MEILTKLEELILLSVWKLGDSAYGTTIYNYISENTGKKISLGGVYFPLDRLTKKGFLDAFKGEATTERRGLSKKYYRLTKKGVAALDEIHEMNLTMWKGYGLAGEDL